MNKKMYLEKFRLGGRVAVVTGGGQGIGLACAEALGEAGARIVIADRDPKVAETGCASLRALGYETEVVIMDVTDPGASPKWRINSRRSTERSISWSTMPASRAARHPLKP